jgi:hypothetical protein
MREIILPARKYICGYVYINICINILKNMHELTPSIEIVVIPYLGPQCLVAGEGIYGKTKFCSMKPELCAQFAAQVR